MGLGVSSSGPEKRKEFRTIYVFNKNVEVGFLSGGPYCLRLSCFLWLSIKQLGVFSLPTLALNCQVPIYIERGAVSLQEQDCLINNH